MICVSVPERRSPRFRICVSLAEPSFRRARAALKGLPMAEIRLDLTPLTPDEIGAIFAQPLPLVATFRPGRTPASERRAALEAAIAAGAAFVDIEAEAAPAYREKLMRLARRRRCRVILSSHSDEKPAPAPRLARLREDLFRRGADIVKIVRRAESAEDCVRLWTLYDTRKRHRVVALGTGPEGMATRVVSAFLGAPFTYASLRPGRETAPGQTAWKTLDRVLRELA